MTEEQFRRCMAEWGPERFVKELIAGVWKFRNQCQLRAWGRGIQFLIDCFAAALGFLGGFALAIAGNYHAVWMVPVASIHVAFAVHDWLKRKDHIALVVACTESLRRLRAMRREFSTAKAITP